jgi:hypothetical protein
MRQTDLRVSRLRRLLDKARRAAPEADTPLKVSGQEDDGNGEVAVSRSSHPRNQALTATGLLLAIVAALIAQQLGGDRAHAATAKAAKSMTLATRTFQLTGADSKQRLVVRCPGRTVAFGGGMKASPAPGQGGEGVYPHSYERLGVQSGWHVTAVLIDPAGGSTQPRSITLQAVCGRRLGHVTPPHTTKYVKPGQTKTAVATCPGRRHLFSGGFQRTDFITGGGNFVTESRAISSKSWRVVGHAFGAFGGEITAIAYCVRSKKPLLSEVSASAPVGGGSLGTATTAACPPGRTLTAGGFSGNGATSLFLTDGVFNTDGTWSASGFSIGAPASVSAYGYCLKA